VKLTPALRAKLPAAAFGDPKRRALAVPDLAHVGPARARLGKMYKCGEYSMAEANRIDARILRIKARLEKTPCLFTKHLRPPRKRAGSSNTTKRTGRTGVRAPSTRKCARGHCKRARRRGPGGRCV